LATELKSILGVKIGEVPPFGGRLSDELLKLASEDRDLFLRGWKAERAGLGIGAFAYYRRVVEEQRSKLVDRIAGAARTLKASADNIALIESARDEQRFKDSIDLISAAIPERLKILDQNPLLLLHKALSVVMHDKTDAQAMELAQTVRLVLADLATKLEQVRIEDNVLKEGVKRLLGEARSE
jgi:hypothetical protein